jgi:DNA-binding NtrC family response regulator
MPLEQQIALLRVLQDRTVTRVGGDRPLVVDVRIICATHKDLREEIRKGLFRQDLYYRLYVTTIPLPPLREHPEDIPALLAAFTSKFASRKGKPELQAAPGLIAALQAYPWPGNIREFQNVVERMIHSAQGEILTVEQIPEEILGPRLPEAAVPAARAHESAAPGGTRNLRELLVQEECEGILASLRRHKGNMSKAAQELGMARNTLYRKVQKFEL